MFRGRQLELHDHHVVGDFVEFLHAAGYDADGNVAQVAHLVAFDYQVGERLGATK